MVPLTGVEPVRFLRRGILSPLCLPIPPQRHIQSRSYFTTWCPIRQASRGGFPKNMGDFHKKTSRILTE